MNWYPVFTRDMMADLRQGRLHKARWMAGGLASLILLALLLTERWSGSLSVPRLVRTLPWAGVIPFVLLVLGLNRAGSLLAVERREGTLPLLLLTRLTGYDVVVGKLLQALVLELALLVATGPALVLPLLAAGGSFTTLLLTGLACGNVLFFGLAVGLFASIIGGGSKVTTLFLLPLLAIAGFATPIGALLPRGPGREVLTLFQSFNPCQALTHLPGVTLGFARASFWFPLLASHALAWLLLLASGSILARACRWQSGSDRGKGAAMTFWWRCQAAHGRWSRRWLLDTHPVLWLTTRGLWPTLQIWLLLGLMGAGWGWLIWLAWFKRGFNLTVVFAVAVAVTWAITLLAIVPREACRRLIEDRDTGALELLLCTPLDVRGIVRGQWLGLRRRYLAPLLTVLASSVILMGSGYMTFGFGGMLDPEDRGLWLGAWWVGIVLLPCWLTAMCWVAMRRALAAQSPGEASGLAFLEVLGMPGFALWGTYWLAVWLKWEPGWGGLILLLLAAFLAAPAGLAWRSRAGVLAQMRDAAAQRYCRKLTPTLRP